MNLGQLRIGARSTTYAALVMMMMMIFNDGDGENDGEGPHPYSKRLRAVDC